MQGQVVLCWWIMYRKQEMILCVWVPLPGLICPCPSPSLPPYVPSSPFPHSLCLPLPSFPSMLLSTDLRFSSLHYTCWCAGASASHHWQLLCCHEDELLYGSLMTASISAAHAGQVRMMLKIVPRGKGHSTQYRTTTQSLPPRMDSVAIYLGSLISVPVW